MAAIFANNPINSRIIALIAVIVCHCWLITFTIKRHEAKATTEVALHSFVFVNLNFPARNLPANLLGKPIAVGKKLNARPKSAPRFHKRSNAQRLLEADEIYSDPRKVLSSNRVSANSNIDTTATEKNTSETIQGLQNRTNSLDQVGSRHGLKLDIHGAMGTPNPNQLAAQDARSNSPRLTKSEKFSVIVGTLDCIFQTRLPNGETLREPGRWIEVRARSEGDFKSLATARFCIRAHQAEDQFGNDMTAIGDGLRGKK